MATQLDDRPDVRAPAHAGAATARRWRATAIIAVLVAAIAVVAALLVANDDDTTTTPTTAAPTTAAPPTTTPSTPVTVPSGDLRTAVFPTDGAGFADPIEATAAFTADLGFRDPVVGELQQGDARSGEVEVRPIADGPVTTVFVRQLGTSGRWFVLGAATSSIQLDSPAALDEVSSPVRLRGTSTAFEANVNVEIRQDAEPRVLGTGFVMGGANGEMGPFDGTVAFTSPSAELGAIVLRTLSMEDGSTWEAAVVRVALTGATTDTMDLQVFFHTGDPADEPVAFTRTVPAGPAVLHAALGQLLAGPTAAEREAGATSWFSDATDLFLDVTLDEGHAVVDLGDLRTVIPNASTSAGSQMLLSQLDATVFQFDNVESVLYRIDGDADAFYQWLQLDTPGS